jgi:nitrite reductase/ring-hydroxylating ferredoxin subunit
VRQDVGADDDFLEGRVRVVEAGGWEVGIVRWQGRFYAVRNVCPHEAGPVCRGLVKPHLVSGGGPGLMGVDDDVPVLACPWHGWEFDVRDGRCLSGDERGVRTYPVSRENGRVLVDVPARRRSRELTA